MGGTSNEREVSLLSGKNVADALESTGKYDVVRVDVKNDSLDDMPKDVARAYIALHGGWGENGGVQAALNKLKIPYTGPGVLASQIAMDKIKTKMVLETKGVPTAAWGVVSVSGEKKCPLPFPVVVKPPKDGSSVGISKCYDEKEFMDGLEIALKTDGEIALVEEFIPGREFTVGVIDGDPLPVIEIVAKGGWYGYEEKYNSDETRYPFPTDDFIPEMQRLALAAFDATGCRGVTRVDFRVTPEGRMFVLELNTSPGMTGHSLVPKAAGKIGISFPELCDRVLGTAVHD